MSKGALRTVRTLWLLAADAIVDTVRSTLPGNAVCCPLGCEICITLVSAHLESNHEVLCVISCFFVVAPRYLQAMDP